MVVKMPQMNVPQRPVRPTPQPTVTVPTSPSNINFKDVQNVIVTGGEEDLAFTGGTILIAGKPYPVDSLKNKDFGYIVQDYKSIMPKQTTNDPLALRISELLNANFELVVNTIRATMRKSGLSYIGKAGTSSGLMLDLLTPPLFGSATNPKYKWEVNYTTAGLNTWLSDPDTPSDDLRIYQDSALVLLGEYKPLGVSAIVDAVDFKKDGNDLPGWSIDYMQSDIVYYPAPIVLLGNDSFMAKHRAIQAGKDYTIPIGIAVFNANNYRPPTAKSPLLGK
ncbi:hypothetical protein [Caldisericum sp.]|uniref:hypothetical protein n=1 Tax=Caldisericum sp. TaxID=2499687 RepID=UPI003D14801A